MNHHRDENSKATRASYALDLYLAFLFRAFLLLGSVALAAILLGGCSAGSDTASSRLGGDIVTRELPPIVEDDGDKARTWNQIPHGGADEKSGYSPCGPLEINPKART
jgi:hypothetical protein